MAKDQADDWASTARAFNAGRWADPRCAVGSAQVGIAWPSYLNNVKEFCLTFNEFETLSQCYGLSTEFLDS